MRFLAYLLHYFVYFWPKITLAKYALCALWENVLHEIHVSGTIGGPLVYQCQGNGIR